MKQASVYLIFFVLGVLLTLFVVYLTGKSSDIDLLSMAKAYPVITKRDLSLVDVDGKKISLPAGTNLLFKSQYREEGTFLLEIVSTDLEMFTKTDKPKAYFHKED